MTHLRKRLGSITRLVMVLGLTLISSCRPRPGSGTVIIRLSADIRAREEMSSMEVVVGSVGVHPVDHPIEANWVTWHPDPSHVDLVQLADGQAIILGEGEVPMGRYDRAWLKIEEGIAQAQDGTPIPLILTVEPIAVPFELRAGNQIGMTIELIALPQEDGSYELFTKSAVIND